MTAIRPDSVHRPAATLVAWLAFALIACNGHLDFGGGSGSGGVGGGTAGTGGTGGSLPPATCSSDGDCRLSVLHCDRTGSQTCVACISDAQCTSPGFPRCDLTIHRCVTCLAPADCAAGLT